MPRSIGLLLVLLAAAQFGGCPILTELNNPAARVTTTEGSFVIELDATAAPVTVANFLQYAEDGFYEGTVFHAADPNAVIVGGGFGTDLREIGTRPPIINESDNGLSNDRGTVAMLRTEAPNSATSQFFVNIVDNLDFDATPDELGFAVFGRVVEGLDVVDQIANVPTEERDGFANLPIDPVVIETVEVIGWSTGEIGLSPEFEEYWQGVEYRSRVEFRNFLVNLLGAAIITGGG